MIEVHPFDPQAATQTEWAALHTFRRARAAEDWPGDPIPTDEHFQADASRIWPLNESRRLAAWQNHAILGITGLNFRRPNTPDYDQHAPYAWLWNGVLTPHRRQGIATHLLRAALPLLEARGVTTITMGAHTPAGQAFATAIGATEKHRSIENRLRIANLDTAMLDSWHRATPTHLTWEIHAGRVPSPALPNSCPRSQPCCATPPSANSTSPNSATTSPTTKPGTRSWTATTANISCSCYTPPTPSSASTKPPGTPAPPTASGNTSPPPPAHTAAKASPNPSKPPCSTSSASVTRT